MFVFLFQVIIYCRCCLEICEQMAHKQHKAIPEDLDYQSIKTISMEAREKLAKVNILVPTHLSLIMVQQLRKR